MVFLLALPQVFIRTMAAACWQIWLTSTEVTHCFRGGENHWAATAKRILACVFVPLSAVLFF